MTEERNFTGPIKLGKYMIRTEIGKGAMGIVYEGFDPFIERVVALKTIRKDLLDSKEADNLLVRFRREAQAAGRLNHPNIVAVYDYDEDGDVAFIAMEFVQGRSLKEYFDNNERFDLSDIIKIMSQVLGALSYAHENGVVHRDIKPANIILTDNAQVKITDFGIAHIESSNLTQTGMIMGTPNFMSPEQFMGNRVDNRSDIFSAGIILYQFITGENPFDGRTMATIMHKVLNAEPVNPGDLNLHISSELNAVIKKAIAKKPEDRFQNAEDFFNSLNLALHNNLHAATPHRVIEPSPEPDATLILSPEKKIFSYEKAKPAIIICLFLLVTAVISACLYTNIYYAAQLNRQFIQEIKDDFNNNGLSEYKSAQLIIQDISEKIHKAGRLEWTKMITYPEDFKKFLNENIKIPDEKINLCVENNNEEILFEHKNISSNTSRSTKTNKMPVVYKDDIFTARAWIWPDNKIYIIFSSVISEAVYKKDQFEKIAEVFILQASYKQPDLSKIKNINTLCFISIGLLFIISLFAAWYFKRNTSKKI
ncbi:serine/threonine protein kinase [Desulfonema limicola]|nr:serine/threonine-protein kinase [Desulfonema limicola]